MESSLTACRACRSENLVTFLPMGDHPPANMFVRPEDRDKPQPAFPLNTQACLDCGLIQVADQIPAGFFEHYLYVPSGAATMHTHFDGLASVLTGLADGGLVVDIGCNDGLMLAAANGKGARTLGIDPARNLAEIAAERGVTVETGYFGPDFAAEMRDKHGPAAVIATSNTLNHIGDLHSFMVGIDRFLADDGVFVVEVPWGKKIVETSQFDNVYHEHVSEMSLRSLVKLAAFFGMDVFDVTKLPVHGGSMRVFFSRKAAGRPIAPIVAEMLADEDAIGMTEAATYAAFAERVEAIKTDLRAELSKLKAEGKVVAGYGAPAKGNTLLNYFDIGPEDIAYLVDKNPLKQGLLSPGKLIPIYGPEKIATDPPDVLLVLAWNFFDEIREQQAAFENAGGRFLVPLPHPHFVPA
ncbi:class I SAM-dependent methyltransferase [Oceanomicrobium pacificus]|uniref:Methyltransferase domain-containing protein n=1 Tax=Oceanomicrobium pacificus TaxID=2692916 RepID=A0A6B0TW51_9RHOB|nr:class I SAM-dependent methyltransferase [Oceanomicrobium pacificus]MXU65223.1 methyltransferase domain-containing protein [Oceanomicrobium pacificus]